MRTSTVASGHRLEALERGARAHEDDEEEHGAFERAEYPVV